MGLQDHAMSRTQGRVVYVPDYLTDSIVSVVLTPYLGGFLNYI